jgi:hypothetical protein
MHFAQTILYLGDEFAVARGRIEESQAQNMGAEALAVGREQVDGAGRGEVGREADLVRSLPGRSAALDQFDDLAGFKPLAILEVMQAGSQLSVTAPANDGAISRPSLRVRPLPDPIMLASLDDGGL